MSRGPRPVAPHTGVTPMSRSTTRTIAAVPLLLALACGGGPPPESGPTGPGPLTPLDDTDRLYNDNGEGITDSVRIVVRDDDALREEWARATRHQSFPAPPPEIDFENDMVIVVGAGRMTPQDRIRVDSVGVRELPDAVGDAERVMLVMVRTIRGCQRLDLDAYPVEIVRVPRFDGPVRFTGRVERDPNCRAPTAAGFSASPAEPSVPSPPRIRGAHGAPAPVRTTPAHST